MTDEFDDRPRQSRRRTRRRHRRRHVREEHRDELSLLTPEERTLREAHIMAERKTELAGETLRYAGIAVVLLLVLPPVGLIMLVWLAFSRGRDFYELILEPKLRERFVQQEVTKRVHATLSQERKALEGEHARSLEELSASIAHEIRNPITAAKSLVQQMEEEPTARENEEYARVALEELDRVERSVSHLLRFAREEEVAVEIVPMADVIDSALETFRDRVTRSGIELSRQLDCEGSLHGDPEKLRRIVINLIGNAIDALDESRTPSPRLSVEMGENLAGTEVWVRIRDNGPGIDTEALQKMWSPFYTSKTKGTGLGLAICKKLVDAHGGEIEVHSQPGDGAEFLLTFPKAGSEGVRS